LLLRQGLTPEFDLQPAEKQFLLKTNHHFSFSSQGDSIEIHWKAAETAYQYPLHPGAMWEGAVIRVIFEREVSCPSPENTILFLCLHGAKHGWYQLKWLADLSHACQAFNSLDWPSLLQRARQTGFLRQVCLGLYLIQQHGGVEFPPPVQLALTEEREVLRLAAQIQKRWFNRGVYTGFLDPYLFYLQTRERLTDRLYNLFDSLILPKQAEWRAVPLPEYFYPAYFFIRPFRLMVIMARLGIQTLRKRFGQ
jgi:hypothetical protein